MNSPKGLTLVEILVALLVFGIVAAIATAGVGNSIRMQALNEATTSAQARLRRVTEVFTQELRSAVLGGVSNDPFPSDGSQISFLLLDGGAGYQVLIHDNGNNNSFKNAANVDILAPVSSVAQLGLVGHEVLMVNGNGDAIVLPIENASRHGGPNSNRYNLVHPKCANTIDFTPGTTVILKVRSLGLSFDGADSTLYQKEGGKDRVPLAFDLSGLRLQYVYQDSTGDPVVLDAPLLDANGVPVREGVVSSEPVTLARVQVQVSAAEPGFGGRSVERSYTGQVEMASNSTFKINKVVECK